MGQNLVMNPSFEDTAKVIIPSKYQNAKGEVGHSFVPFFYSPTQGSPDFHNSNQAKTFWVRNLCLARTGEGRIGIITNNVRKHEVLDTVNRKCDDDSHRVSFAIEYFQTKLKRTLVKDSLYEVSFYIVLDKNSNYYSKHLGALFSALPISQNNINSICLSPQIQCYDAEILSSKKEWKQIKSIYKANGGENYITIGRFGFDQSYKCKQRFQELNGVGGLESVYYYIDDCTILNVQDTAKYYQAVREKNATINNFVYLLDASASMLSGNNFKLMLNQLQSQIKKLNQYDKVSILTFSNNGNLLLKNCFAKDTNIIFNALKSIKIEGVTNIKTGLTSSTDFLLTNYITNGSNHIIIATDGLFKIENKFLKETSNKLENKNINVSTIYYGKQHNKSLHKINSKTNGMYIPILEPNKNNFMQFESKYIYKTNVNENLVRYHFDY